MHFPKTDLGTFEGERLAAARRARPDDGSLLRDIASLIAIVAFWAAVSFVVVGILMPELPR